ncbi:MAG: glycosyltransferase [Chthoniobacterales bacterium]
MIQVLHIIDGFALGGAQTVVLEIVKHIDKKNFAIEVAGMHGEGPFYETIKATGIPVHVLSEKKWPPNYLWNLLRLLRSKKYDIIHYHLFGANWIARPLSCLASPKSIRVSHDHCNDALRWKNPVALLTDTFTNQLADHIFAVSKSTEKFLTEQEALSHDKVSTLYNGIDTQEFRPASQEEKISARRSLNLPEKSFLVMGIGRLVEQKNFEGFLHIAKRVSEEHPDCFFAIAGTGLLQDKLTKQIRDLNLSKNVHLLGFVQNRVELLQAADCLLLPSHFEGLPMTLLEAMATGLPVVASSTDGIREILETSEDALLHPVEKEHLFADSLIRLIKSPRETQYRGNGLRQLCLQKFSSLQQLSTLEKFYKLLNSEKIKQLV